MLTLCELGHVSATAKLVEAGWSRRGIAAEVLAHRAYRPRKGTLACAHLRDDDRLAAWVGGQLDCVSVLRCKGVWAGHDRRVHLSLQPHSGRAGQRIADSGRAPERIVVHWRAPGR